MPTFTTIAWETLIEPRVRDSYKDSLNSKQQITKSDYRDDGDDEKDEEEKKTKGPNHIYISPALYVTPEPTPVPDSSSGSLSPSPYVVRRKRHGGGGGEATERRVDGFEVQQKQKQQVDESNSGCGCVDDVSNEEPCIRLGQQEVDHDNFLDGEIVEDDFFDPRCDSASVASSVELNDCGKQVGNISGLSSHGDFYDADEDFLSDESISNVSSYGPSIESQLLATRLSLLDEIERREAAQDALGQMHSQWQRVGNALSEVGLTFPAPLTTSDVQLEINSIEQVSQELVVARFVAEAIARGQARAEAELTAEAILESKDQEMSRLRDKLQYYEAVNHEMSQRNQEIVEVARRQRKRKNSQRRWVWSCIGLSVTIGASLLAYSYLPQTSKDHSSLTSSDSPDGSCGCSS
ncbi:uncharacterized protein LOC132294488 [Cornus florida]|uniref:uncharacterized protein LOC132294488 n=1 Tax=Cornus florida TaxID=4283 RepID=UPI0028A19A6F|nr:uncharacterized protein LOC132294488 [Cornus florida]